MKKLVQISIVVVIAFALILGQFQIGSAGALTSSVGNGCRVGWNTRIGPCVSPLPSYRSPNYTPNVGWNG